MSPTEFPKRKQKHDIHDFLQSFRILDLYPWRTDNIHTSKSDLTKDNLKQHREFYLARTDIKPGNEKSKTFHHSYWEVQKLCTNVSGEQLISAAFKQLTEAILIKRLYYTLIILYIIKNLHCCLNRSEDTNTEKELVI